MFGAEVVSAVWAFKGQEDFFLAFLTFQVYAHAFCVKMLD
jgi:hypothetical protein